MARPMKKTIAKSKDTAKRNARRKPKRIKRRGGLGAFAKSLAKQVI